MDDKLMHISNDNVKIDNAVIIMDVVILVQFLNKMVLPPIQAATRVLMTARPITSPSPGASIDAYVNNDKQLFCE